VRGPEECTGQETEQRAVASRLPEQEMEHGTEVQANLNP
jgi:hypothetical protein